MFYKFFYIVKRVLGQDLCSEGKNKKIPGRSLLGVNDCLEFFADFLLVGIKVAMKP